MSEGEEPAVEPQPLFVTTRWSVVLAAQDRSSPDSAAALEMLCRAYWKQEFDCLKNWLTAERGGIPYAQIAATLATTEGAARVAVHRLRKRFRGLFRQSIAETVDGSGDVDAELRHLVAVLSRA